MSRVATFIGDLVMAGYMASYDDDTIRLHDSTGRCWAAIDPWGMSYSITSGSRRSEAATTDEVLRSLDELAQMV